MSRDITLPIEDGFVNMRVGAIIGREGKLLMVGNERMDYLYSVGGRIQFGETAEQAVCREVREETGVELEIDRLGFIEENYFYCDAQGKEGRLIYEIAFYFYMKTPENFEPVCRSVSGDGAAERLEWISPDTERMMYPRFFRTALSDQTPYIRHVVTDDRNI